MFLESMLQNKVAAIMDVNLGSLRACCAGAGMSWVGPARMWLAAALSLFAPISQSFYLWFNMCNVMDQF